MYLGIQLLRQVFHALSLIIDIRLDVILNQFRHDINIVIQHLNVHIITFTILKIGLDIVYPGIQRVNVAHQNLQPGAALTV